MDETIIMRSDSGNGDDNGNGNDNGHGKRMKRRKVITTIPAATNSPSSAVVSVMVEEVIYDGLLIKIFEYVHYVETTTLTGTANEHDNDEIETIIPRRTQDDMMNLRQVSKRFYRIISNHEENGTKKWDIIPVLEISPPSVLLLQQQHQQQFDGIETLGYRVIGVQPDSPASKAGLVSVFDFIIGANQQMLLGRNGLELEEGDEFEDVVDFPLLFREAQQKNTSIDLVIWNINSQQIRVIQVDDPTNNWGNGFGSLGATIKLDTFKYGGAYGYGSQRKLFNNFYEYSLNENINNNLQNYRHIIVKAIHNFIYDLDRDDVMNQLLRNKPQLNGIVSLCLFPSSKPISDSILSNSVNRAMVYFLMSLFEIVPNLREIDFSKMNCDGIGLVFCVARAPNLETIRWDGIHANSGVKLSGFQMNQYSNLKQISMDNSIFECELNGGKGFVNFETEEEEEEEEDNPPNNNIDNNNDDDEDEDENNDDDDDVPIFIFHQCCDNLEHVSIQNAKYFMKDNNDGDAVIGCITQNSLIKFVRNAPPTLKWFRSDLSPEHIHMLQKERPAIEFF